MLDFTAKDLQFLKIMRILPPEEPELTARKDLEPLMGQEYWGLMERTAARVSRWPVWKTGTRRKGDENGITKR